MMINFQDFLKSQNIVKVFFSAGSRNEKILSTFESYEIEHGFDERYLAFKALGLAKVTERPVVLCVTSGTAVSESLSALIEAHYSNVKLILVAADRPLSLQNSGAPQEINQGKLLELYAKSFIDLDQISKQFSIEDLKYPVAFNIRVEDRVEYRVANKKNEIDGNTLFILNKTIDPKSLSSVYQLLVEKSLWHYQEVESPFYSKSAPSELLYDEDLQKMLKEEAFSNIVRIGALPSSKFWRNLYTIHSDVFVSNYTDAQYPGLDRGEVSNNYSELVAKVQKLEIQDHRSLFINDISGHLIKFPKSEISFFANILKCIDQEQGILFLGNSMPIRYMKFFKPQNLKIIANRGANGIDGLIASAIGVANGAKIPVYLFIGDLSFLYDLNSLLYELPSNLKIIIFNNRGGQIFARVKSSKDVINSHDFSFTKTVHGFGKKMLKIDCDKLEFKLEQINELCIDNQQTENFWEWFLGTYR
jgi:2-succinyl-5-enolpyruvyl-6-hydroxy-3-cyclohexene-1-carboxylate synthase